MEGQDSPASGDRRLSPSALSSLSCGMILNLFLPSEPLLLYLRNERESKLTLFIGSQGTLRGELLGADVCES